MDTATDRIRRDWDSQATNWYEQREYLLASSRPIHEWLVEHLAPTVGQRVLEIGAGPGDTGFLVAPHLGNGRLLSTDISPSMVEAALKRGGELHIENVDHRVLDAQAMDLDDASFDGVICRWGFMLMPDPASALRETRRVLKPGGRLVFAVFTGPNENPFASLPAGILSEMGYLPPPSSEWQPGILALADRGRLQALLDDAGFTSTEIESVNMTWSFHDADGYWDFLTELTALGPLIRSLPDAARDSFCATINERLIPFTHTNGIALPRDVGADSRFVEQDFRIRIREYSKQREKPKAMFDFLKGGKANLIVTLNRATKTYTPGETIHASVRVEGVKDLKIQSAKVALVSREEYEYKYEDRDSDGDTETRTSKTTDEVTVWQQQFSGETTIKANTNQTFEFDIPLPSNALPSIDSGKILNHEWLFKTTLDRKLLGDVEDKQTIYVPSGASDKMRGAGVYGSSNEPGEAELSLRVPNTQFAVGDTIAGEFIIRPQKDFDVTDIRIEFIRIENVPRDEGNTVQESQPVKLAGGTKLTRGNEMVMPFQLKIPGSAPVTCRTRHGSIEWTLKGVLSRRMRGDTYVEQEIYLYSAPFA